MRNHLKEILFALTDGGVHYIVGGGVAAVLHGVERVTMDLDIAVDMTPDNLSRFATVMNQLGMKPRVPVPVESLQDPEVVRMIVEDKRAMVFAFIDPEDPVRYVDLFMTKELSYSVLKPGSETVEVDGRELIVLGRGKLLELKRAIQPPRDKDLFDIRQLERMVADEYD